MVDRMTPLRIASLLLVIGSPAGAFAPRVEPRAVSVHPFVAQPGTMFTAVVRGNGLRGATSIFLQDAPLAIAIEGTEAEPPAESGGRSRTPFDRVRLRVEVARDARPGRYPFRIVTPQGISNSLVLDVSEHPVVAEPDGSHEDPETAIAVASIPVVFAGRIARRGETDYYALEAKAGETMTFEAISGLPSIGAPGGNAQGFDPQLQVFQQSGSWFDPKRWNRIAANDEPLWVIVQAAPTRISRTASGARDAICSGSKRSRARAGRTTVISSASFRGARRAALPPRPRPGRSAATHGA